MRNKRTLLAKLTIFPLLAFVACAFAASEPLEGSKPDYVVYRPLQPRGGKNADPTKRGDCYNDHFQVIWDDARKLYYAFWTQGSGEGYGDMHVCLSKSADRGRTWTYPKLIAGGEKIAEPKPRAVWQQPMLAKSGRLYCLWNQQVNDETLHHGVVYGAYSDDGGETWSRPEQNNSIPRQFRDDWKGVSLPSWCNWQRPLRLAEGGKFLVACTRHGTGRGEPHRSLAIEFWRFENIDENPEIRDIKITVLSGGKDAIRVPAGDTGRFICEEAGIVKLPDGRLFALMRTRNRHPYWVQSHDGGVSWSEPAPLRDANGEAYLHPCSPCPLYDVNGCEAASGEYVAFIHNAYDDSIPPLGRQPRGPVYMIRGRFDPKSAQPIVFGTPELFSPVKSGNSYYASFTCADGESVLWFAHQKHFLIGRKIDRGGKAAAATPVWIDGAEKEMNAFYGFSAPFDVKAGERPVLRLSAGAIARVWVNGRFAGCGPARAPEGSMRIDEWPLGDFVNEGRNIIAIEVSNPAINTFYLPEQSGFLLAEVVAGGRTLAATGRDFRAMRLPRVAKTSRFSYQREFAEFYSVTPESYGWRTHGITGAGLSLVSVPMPKSLGRGAPYPTFEFDGTFRPTVRTVLKRDPSRKVKELRYINRTGNGSLKGFAKESLEVNFSDAIQQLAAARIEPVPAETRTAFRLKGLEGVVFEGEKNTAGFPKIEVQCVAPATIWLVMDELAGPDGLPNPVRFFSCVNACGWRLEKPGRYTLECFQPYGLKCAHVIVEGGEAEIVGFDVRTYLNPDAARASFRCSDAALGKVFSAAAQSLACNAVDVFTDCPGRERGAYFGDTVFTGRGANILLGGTAMERTQFENYALAPRFVGVPEGLMPMLYPGDTVLGEAHWIPNFCMWTVIQLADYVRRGGDAAMAAAFRPKAEGVLAWFRKSRNADGLLENLPGWVFIEWSDAARFTKGINYPTNMLYIRFLDAFAELYGEAGCREEAETLRKTIRSLSWNGEWFRDHSERGADGLLETPNDCTEVCQYLAFFSGVATARENPALWRRLVEELGPMRKADAYPALHRSNMLFGYSLRFVMLSDAGLSARVLKEVRHCYLPMAEKTGTLWEAVSSDGYSCCHGFPCLAAWLLVRDALGVKSIDRTAQTVEVSPAADLPLDWCEGSVPLSASETMAVKWRKDGQKLSVQVNMPSGWRRL